MQNGDRALLTFRITTLTVVPPPPPPPPPAPDLVISNFTGDEVTVRNQGAVAAGPFRVTVRSASGDTNFEFTGLAVGQSETRAYSRPCEETRQALADPLNQVAESDEQNNTASFANQLC